MAETVASSWSIAGEYFENCNCAVVCPCLFSTSAPLTSEPTEGACEVAFAFHIDQGAYGDVTLDGLNAALIARTPGPMIEGNWTAALYVDERADARQQEALGAIFTGQAGGVMGSFAPLIAEVLGVKAVPIAYHSEGRRRAVEIPDIMTMAVRAAPSVMGEDQELVAVNAHPFAPDGVVIAAGEEGSTWTDYGLRWDNSGRNVHCRHSLVQRVASHGRSRSCHVRPPKRSPLPIPHGRPARTRAARPARAPRPAHDRRVGADDSAGADDGHADGRGRPRGYRPGRSAKRI